MNIMKLPSGNWRIRETRNGKTYSLTVDFKPKKYEAFQLIEEKIAMNSASESLSLKDAVQKYLDIKEHVLSPSTLKGYTSYLKKFSDKFASIPIENVTLDEIQAQVDRWALEYSAKYTKNIYGLLSSTLALFRPEFNVSKITLPKVKRTDPYIPIDKDVKNLLSQIQNSEFEIPIALAAFGMRRSEICALTIDDIHDGYILVNKTKVQDKDGKWVINKTNNKSEERRVYIPKKLEEKIRNKGYIFKYTPDTLTNGQRRILKKLGITHFSPHKLRHYFASVAHSLDIPDAYILETGGWKTDHVMKSVYRHALEDKTKEMKDRVIDHIEELIS